MPFSIGRAGVERTIARTHANALMDLFSFSLPTWRPQLKDDRPSAAGGLAFDGALPCKSASRFEWARAAPQDRFVVVLAFRWKKRPRPKVSNNVSVCPRSGASACNSSNLKSSLNAPSTSHTTTTTYAGKGADRWGLETCIRSQRTQASRGAAEAIEHRRRGDGDDRYQRPPVVAA